MTGSQLAYIILGTVFLFFGLTCCTFAASRRRTEVHVLIWLGVWSCLFGANLMVRTPAFLANATRYFFVVFELLAWSELTVGNVRLFTRIAAILELAIALVGIGMLLFTGSGDLLLPYTNLLAGCVFLVLVILVVVPKLAARFLVASDRVLAVGTLAFVLDAAYRNPWNRVHLRPGVPDDFVLGFFLCSFSYVAARKVFADERRSIEVGHELELARRIHQSILPGNSPTAEHLRIAVSHSPVAEVGADFYEFIALDKHRVGFLVADVSGRGMDAALSAAMIKVAAQAVVPYAEDPAEVLRRLNHTLFGHLRGAVSAAYLWVDTEMRRGLYSAAGHPPSILWRRGKWQKGKLSLIESNGLLFGVLPDTQYPVVEITFQQGDCFLMYTNGLLEPENIAGVSFGERRLEQIVRNSETLSPAELVEELLSALQRWQHATAQQQDDITLVVVDVV